MTHWSGLPRRLDFSTLAPAHREHLALGPRPAVHDIRQRCAFFTPTTHTSTPPRAVRTRSVLVRAKRRRSSSTWPFGPTVPSRRAFGGSIWSERPGLSGRAVHSADPRRAPRGRRPTDRAPTRLRSQLLLLAVLDPRPGRASRGVGGGPEGARISAGSLRPQLLTARPRRARPSLRDPEGPSRADALRTLHGWGGRAAGGATPVDQERLRRLVLVSSAAYGQHLPPFVKLARMGWRARLLFAAVPKRRLTQWVLRSIVHDPSAVSGEQVKGYAEPLGKARHRLALIRTALSIVPGRSRRAERSLPRDRRPDSAAMGASGPGRAALGG